MINPVIYIFLNKSLHMSVGKAAAQAAHAAAMGVLVTRQDKKDVWLQAPHKTIIVLEARDADHLRNIQQYLLERTYTTRMIIDEGVNEIDPHVPTALTSMILDKDNDDTKLTFSSFDLYKDIAKLTVEFEK